MSMGEETSVNRLRETIHHLGKSVEQVAKDLNLGKRTLYNYIHGKVVVPEELRPQFAAYLSCSQEFLFPHPSQWLSAAGTFGVNESTTKEHGKKHSDITEIFL